MEKIKNSTACIHSSLNVTKMIQSRRKRWRKVYQAKIKISNSNFVGNPKKIQVGRAQRSCEEIIKRRLKETACEGADCIHLAEDSLVPLNTATKHPTPQMAENFLSISLSRRTPRVNRFHDRPAANDEEPESQNRFPSHTFIQRPS